MIHDYHLQRVAGHPGKVAELTYKELKEIDIGNGEHVPLLSDVFALVVLTSTMILRSRHPVQEPWSGAASA